MGGTYSFLSAHKKKHLKLSSLRNALGPSSFNSFGTFKIIHKRLCPYIFFPGESVNSFYEPYMGLWATIHSPKG
jgi:hypothetical protein